MTVGGFGKLPYGVRVRWVQISSSVSFRKPAAAPLSPTLNDAKTIDFRIAMYGFLDFLNSWRKE
ncbi:MAG: hypothetical protein KDI07_20370, partial [Anaerolineae bacterium]|nr:hypothetical protein [Anaerolineae bacterium]